MNRQVHCIALSTLSVWSWLSQQHCFLLFLLVESSSQHQKKVLQQQVVSGYTWVVSPMYHLPKVAWIEKSTSWARSPVKPGESPGHWSRIVLLATFWRSWIAGDVSMIGRKGKDLQPQLASLSGSIGKLSCSSWSQDSSHLQEYYVFGRGSLLSLHLPLFLLIFGGWVIEWNLTDFQTSGNCNTESLIAAGWEKSTDNTNSCNFLHTDIGALVFALTHRGCLSIERLFVLAHFFFK